MTITQAFAFDDEPRTILFDFTMRGEQTSLSMPSVGDAVSVAGREEGGTFDGKVIGRSFNYHVNKIPMNPDELEIHVVFGLARLSV